MPEGWDEARLDATLFPRSRTAAADSTAEKESKRTPPDFAAIHEQLRNNKYVTLQLRAFGAQFGEDDAGNLRAYDYGSG